MTIILDIDAAWTAMQPDGVTLVSSAENNWHLIRPGLPSHQLMADTGDGMIAMSRSSGSIAKAPALLAAGGKIAGAAIS